MANTLFPVNMISPSAFTRATGLFGAIGLIKCKALPKGDPCKSVYSVVYYVTAQSTTDDADLTGSHGLQHGPANQMKAKADRIKKLSEAFAAMLHQQQQACEQMISSLAESVRLLQADTADRRLQLILVQLNKLKDQIRLLGNIAERDFLANIEREADELGNSLSEGRAASVILALLQSPSSSSNDFCDSLLDRLIEATGAERGFILFYLPESTEADVIAARNFQTRNLSLAEYNFSRTLLRKVFEHGESLLLEDASRDAAYSKENSVIKFQLKSVLAVPLRDEGRPIGAIYLENNTAPCAFDEEDPRLVENVARFAVFYLRHSGLLPAALEQDNRVFLDATRASKEIIGEDPKILALHSLIIRIADSPATVLIEGESGTGKELVARALHYQSERRDRPFVAINCAAIPETLLESELFGHEKGAFTGATDRYIGRIEQGHGGTILLDEVSELAYTLQGKLLRFLQSNELSRLGGKDTIRIDARVVAATSRDLKAMMEAGKFQEALYYRLNVIPLRLPPLAERKGDIPLLVAHFLNKFSAIYGKQARLEGPAIELLKDHLFHGNVRELENLIHRLVALAQNDVIGAGDLPEEILKTHSERISLQPDPLHEILQTPPADLIELRLRKQQIRRTLAEQERQLIQRVVDECGGNLTEAASRLGLHRITLHRILKRV
jgi:Nif-specific regulatory protein